MNDEPDLPSDPRSESGALDGALVDAVAALLADPAAWADPPAGLDDAIVAEIATAAGTARRSPSRWPRLLAAAAVLAVVAVGTVIALAARDAGEAPIALALAGTELAPAARGEARFERTDRGLRIVLDVDDLPPAPDGRYYQGWMRNPSGAVSVGSFHLRDGSGPIELWCGVDDPSYDTLAVTLEVAGGDGGDARSSGEVVLLGRFEGPTPYDR